jgi:hypothetical protein
MLLTGQTLGTAPTAATAVAACDQQGCWRVSVTGLAAYTESTSGFEAWTSSSHSWGAADAHSRAWGDACGVEVRQSVWQGGCLQGWGCLWVGWVGVD